MTNSSPLPGNTIRVGVTGTRARADADRPHVREQVTALLNQIARATGPDGTSPRLQLLSPLAEGADRLAATCALDAHYELVCPLPFPQAVYDADFQQTPGSVAEFHSLLERAGGRVLALDGARDDKAKGVYAEARSYEAVGRLIVRNCDLIIGIWDGAPGKGSGGTADTIRYSATQGPPVVWIDATAAAAAPRWIEDLHDLRHNAPPVPVEAKLDPYLDSAAAAAATTAPRRRPRHLALDRRHPARRSLQTERAPASGQSAGGVSERTAQSGGRDLARAWLADAGPGQRQKGPVDGTEPAGRPYRHAVVRPPQACR